jgi:hypothetical protein
MNVPTIPRPAPRSTAAKGAGATRIGSRTILATGVARPRKVFVSARPVEEIGQQPSALAPAGATGPRPETA